MFHPSPLKLEGYGIRAFSFSTDGEYDPENAIDYDGLKLNVEREYKTNTENPSLHFIKMKISAKPKEKGAFPYSISLDIGGIFEARPTETCTEDKLKAIMYINGATILYGVAREYIYMATCHNMCGPFMLPSVSFASSPSQQKVKSKPKKITS